MTSIKPTPHHLRLTERFFLFDPDRGIHVSREWAQGEIVAAQRDIELLERYAAPVERIAIEPKEYLR
jgi:hypothetical protein